MPLTASGLLEPGKDGHGRTDCRFVVSNGFSLPISKKIRSAVYMRVVEVVAVVVVGGGGGGGVAGAGAGGGAGC